MMYEKFHEILKNQRNSHCRKTELFFYGNSLYILYTVTRHVCMFYNSEMTTYLS